MTEFFGVSMTLIMVALLALLAVSLAAVALIYVRNRIIFQIGLRNIPRRRAQSTLIVLGLMLSTVIIAAAFTTGDTVTYSITNETYQRLGHVDEIVQVRDNQKETSLKEEQIAPAGTIPGSFVDELIVTLQASEDVDGVLPALRFPAPAENRQKKLREPEIVVIGVDPNLTAGFDGDIVTPKGAPAPFSTLRFNETLVNEDLREALQLNIGDRIDVYLGRVPRTLTVIGFVQSKLLTGWTQGEENGMLVSLSTARLMLLGDRNAGSTGFIAISNKGGVRDSLGRTGSVVSALGDIVSASRYEVSPIKQERVERAENEGNNMTAIFVVLGMFSIAAGLLLIFLILVMLAAERRTEMGMSRAIGMTRLQLVETFLAEGMAYNIVGALVGVLLGVIVSLGMTRAMAYIFDAFDVGIAFHVTGRSLAIAYSVGIVLTFATVALSAWRVSQLAIATAIRDIVQATQGRGQARSLAIVTLFAAAGVVLTAYGIADDRAYAAGGGISLIVIAAATAGAALGAPQRAMFSAAGLAVLALWGLIAGDTIEFLTGSLDAGVEMFFVSGVLMVAAATFVVIYNADLLLAGIGAIGIVFARAVPALRPAIAYPLSNKFRTGMTIAMLSLVVFALVMISTMNLNFRELFLSEDARGGWDVVVEENVTNPLTEDPGNRLGPLGEALDRAFYNTRRIEMVGQVLVGNPRTTQIIERLSDGTFGEPHSFGVHGVNNTFIDNTTIGFQARATGFDSDREVWEAVKSDPNNAVIDGSVVSGINYANVIEDRFTLRDYESGQPEFAPFSVQITDTSTQKVRPVRIIGIMNRAPSETFPGMYIKASTFSDTLPALFSRYYIRLAPDLDAEKEAREIQSTLATQGVSADSIRALVEEDQRLSSAFFYLLQGFMALGLGVGIAALGVIAFRTVVERRQQIGLMRAIGFSRASIAMTFVLESAFIAALGIVNGIWLALLLANRVLASDQFSTAGFTTFHVPWLQIAIMAALVFAASVLTTVIPSRQASSIPIAEALRYE